MTLKSEIEKAEVLIH